MMIINANGIPANENGMSGWLWVGIIAGLLILVAVVVLCVKQASSDEVKDERATSEMIGISKDDYNQIVDPKTLLSED